jgi:hypothetical protein
MVLMSAVTPAPEEGSNPAMVRTIGGFSDMDFGSSKSDSIVVQGPASHIGGTWKLLSGPPAKKKSSGLASESTLQVHDSM